LDRPERIVSSMFLIRSKRRPGRAIATLFTAVLLVTGCASVDFKRTETDAGTFRSSAWSVTLLGIDLPSKALMVARANASDSGMVNMEVTAETQRPYLGRFNWVLSIFSIRYARIEGTWGFPSQEQGRRKTN
jgi:hypothetical protein